MVKTELEWYSLTEKEPDVHDYVLILYNCYGNRLYECMWYRDGYFERDSLIVTCNKVIAWSELPKEGEYHGEKNS